MVLGVLNSGTLGVRISLLSISPPLEIPLATVATLFICLSIILPIKKVGVFGKLIG